VAGGDPVQKKKEHQKGFLPANQGGQKSLNNKGTSKREFSRNERGGRGSQVGRVALHSKEEKEKTEAKGIW